MAWLSEFDGTKVLLFTLILSRVSGLLVTAPVLSSSEMPMQFRALLAGALSLLLVPTQWHVVLPEPGSVIHFGVLIGSELLVGLCLGMGVTVLFVGIEAAGELIERTGGISMSEVYDPTSGNSVPLISRLLSLLTLAVFMCMGGHRVVLAAFLDTFQSLPLGSCAVPVSISDTFVTLITQSCALGLRAAMPTTAALLLATLVVGLVGRTLPQLNVLALGFGLNALLTFGALTLSLGAAVWLFQDQLEPTLESLLDGLQMPMQSQWLPE
jgi:flagellar biosynthetic protein FliR